MPYYGVMRYFLSGFFIIAILSSAKAQDTVARRVVFLGDTGGDESVTEAIRKGVVLDVKTTVVFLGNERFGIDSSNSSANKLLKAIEHSRANAIFVPGKDDWNNGKANGQQMVREKSDRIKTLHSEQFQVLPIGGCPGPANVSLDDNTELIIMDSQWWLHEYDKPGVESACDYKTKQQVMDELEDIVSDSRGKFVIFVTHHPFKSTGLRSGYFGIKQHVFPLTDINGLGKFYVPLPIIGSLYPITRSVWISRQDMTHSKYEEMVSSLDNILKEHPHLVRVAGHERIMELYRENDNYYITSGASTRTERVQKTPKTEYVSNARGFVVLEVTSSKKVNTVFYKVKDAGVEVAYSRILMDFSTMPPIAQDTAKLPFTSSDSVTAVVNGRFNEASGLQRWLIGENYRKEWATPVTLSTFNIGTDKGGFKIEGQGGGKQTTTIRLEDASGQEWSLRSITKDPEKVIPENFRNTFAQDAINDILSASHPYAAGPVTALSRALGMAAPQVEYYFVPNDTALGYYRPAFANTVAMLEEKDPSLYGEKTVSTSTIFNKRLEKPGVEVDQQSYLKARMLDFLIGDFDRHYEQFKWGEREENGRKVIYVVPKDRDQAFFRSDGVVMRLFAYNNMPFLKGFRYDIPSPHWYGFVARDVDGLFLNQLNREDWKAQLTDINVALTDSVIEQAVKVLPPAIYKIDSAAMTGKLLSRRDELQGKGLMYYSFLAKKVNVVGTNLDDEFRVSASGKDIKVEMFQKDTSANEKQISYSRVFSEEETKEIRFYGLNGSDVFRIGEDVSTRIKFRIVGGKGEDIFDISGNAKNIVYDDASEDNEIIGRRRTTNLISHRKDVNSYEFRENTYNSSRIPTINVGFNIEDQFMAGLGVSFTKQGFRKAPFASQHQVSSLVSFVNQAYQVKYSGEVIDIYRHYDLVMNAALVNPHLNNFFGLGNETIKDPLKPLSYYRVRFSSLSGDVAARKRFIYNKMSISIGPSFYYYWNNLDENSGRILSYPADVGLDSTNVYTSKFYVGGHLAFRFSTMQNDLLPVKGITWSTGLISLASVTSTGLPVTRLSSDLSLYAPLSSNRRFTFVLHTGGGHIFSDNFEYFQALTLGANNFLRGYRKNRFSGSTMAYASTELRMRLFKLQSRILPGDFGLVGFNDLGRVWIKPEHSGKWHSSQGGGIYFTPFNLVMLSALVARSEEETLFNLSIGTRLNVTF